MKLSLLFSLLISTALMSQNLSDQLAKKVKALLDSSPGYSSNLSFYVSDLEGNHLYEYNGNRGLSSASTQKIFTAAAALETLGEDYRWETTISYGGLRGNELSGFLKIQSNGDPTLGSWRYDNYKPEDFKQKLLNALKEKGIEKISGTLWIDDSLYDLQTHPGGYPWNDLGNYYGAGVFGVNWRENQFDMNMMGREIRGFNVPMDPMHWVSEVKEGGSSDQSLIFTAPYSNVGLINGTLPRKAMTVSGSLPNPPETLALEIEKWLREAGIEFSGKIQTSALAKIKGETLPKGGEEKLFTYYSPELKRVVYWFMRKSVNLYGECFVKTMAYEKTKQGSHEKGIDYLKQFWRGKGIQSQMINFADGSGLSPQNYVSARAEVQALIWARKQSWFNSFYEGFPTQGNGMKMKSGTMQNTKSFAGYHKSKSGKTYVFAILLNNYQSSNLSGALYEVLSPLK